MAKLQLKSLQNQIECVLTYLEPFLPLANCHMVDYFTNSSFDTCVPHALRTEIVNSGYKNVLNILLNDKIDPQTPILNEFISTTKSFRLYNLKDICLNRSDLVALLKTWGCDDISSLKLEVFVTPKKSHEVEILGAISAAICSLRKTTHLIDIGDGKGYLSSILALHHQIPVLGIDASIVKTDSAVKRVRKLEKVWKGIVKNSKRSVPSSQDALSNYKNSDKLYKQVTKFVTKSTNFEELIRDVFSEESSNFGLVGLHTCGNLGSNSVKIFKEDATIRTLCNVSCCYHLLTEEFNKNEENSSGSESFGFPLSNFLRNRKVVLGRNARMLSAQSIDRILLKKKLPNKIIFYRAVLEILFEKYHSQINTKQIGRFRKETKSFVEYVEIALQNNEIKLPVTSEELQLLFENYKEYEVQLHVFYLLRCMLAPVIESLILLDRCLYLHENGYESALLVQLFDPVISPRCYGLIALK